MMNSFGSPCGSPIGSPVVFNGRTKIPRTDLFAWFTSKYLTDGATAYIDRFATGTHEAEKAVYLDIGLTQTIVFSGMGAGVTVSSHSGTAAVALSSGTLSCSSAGTLFDLILSDGSTYSCGQGIGSLLVCDQIVGIDGTLTGFTLPTDWKESVLTGHSWNQTGWLKADGGGTYDEGAKVPLSYVGTESGTAYTGTARQNLQVIGYTGDWDGVVYAQVTDSILQDPNYVKLEFAGVFNSIQDIWFTQILTKENDTDRGWWFQSGSNNTTSAIRVDTTGGFNQNWQLPRVFDDQYHKIVAEFDNGTVKVWFDDALVLDDTYSHGDGFEVSNPLTFMSRSSHLKVTKGEVHYVKFYNTSGTLIHHWVCQSLKTCNQDKIYDIVGGNHADLVGATLPFFTAEMAGSHLLESGYEISGINYIPAGANTNPLTVQSGNWSAVAEYEALETLEWKAADVGDFWFTDETPNRVTYAQIAAWTDGVLSDQWFYSETKQQLVGYNTTQIDPALTRVLRYLGLL